VARGQDRALGLRAIDEPLHVAARVGDAAVAGRGREMAGQVVQIDVQALVELERATARDFTPADPAARARVLARRAYAGGKLAEARQHWAAQDGAAQGPMDLTMLAEILADGADPRARQAIDELRAIQPAEADAIEAQRRHAAGDRTGSLERLLAAFAIHRQDPWAHREVMTRALQLAWTLASEDAVMGRTLFDALGESFAVRALDMHRLYSRAALGLRDVAGPLCAPGLAPLEPFVPWQRDFLKMRADCYERLGSPLVARARADLATFLAAAAPRPEPTR
jgi:hypothetical protein